MNKIDHYRVGIGYDSHKFVKGKKFFLCGKEIDFPYGLKGHSDADVVLHSICDALLGACGLPDIGELFPDTDIKTKGISSRKIVSKVLKLLKNEKFKIVNIDVVIVCDKFKISPMKEKLLASLKKIFKIENINIKGKTTENESKEYIYVYSIVLVKKYESL